MDRKWREKLREIERRRRRSTYADGFPKAKFLYASKGFTYKMRRRNFVPSLSLSLSLSVSLSLSLYLSHTLSLSVTHTHTKTLLLN